MARREGREKKRREAKKIREEEEDGEVTLRAAAAAGFFAGFLAPFPIVFGIRDRDIQIDTGSEGVPEE